MMIKTIPQAVEFVLESIQNITPGETYSDLDRQLIMEEILEYIGQSIKDKLTEEDKSYMEAIGNDGEKLENFLKSKVNDYEGLLIDSVNEVITNFILS